MIRKSYYDVLRVTAILLVLLNHLPIYRMFMYQHGVGEVACLVFSVIVRINVPLFAMLSGALLLGRDESYGEVWHKRMKNMLLVTVGCTLLLYLGFVFLRHRPFSVSKLFYGLLAGDLKDFDSYWFLYAYLGFLLFLPLYRSIAQRMNRSDFCLLLGVHAFLFTVIPLANLALKFANLPPVILSNTINTALVRAPLIFYPLMGYYVDKKIDVDAITRRQWMVLALCALLGVILTAGATFVRGITWGYTQGLLNLFTYVLVIVFFLAVKKLCSAKRHGDADAVAPPSLFVKVVTFFSPLCFGVYLLDPLMKLLVYDKLKVATASTIGLPLFSLLMCLFSFVSCAGVTWLFLKVRKTLR